MKSSVHSLGLALALAFTCSLVPASASAGMEAGGDVHAEASGVTEHGGGLNACGCHFNRKTGGCHCQLADRHAPD